MVTARQKKKKKKKKKKKLKVAFWLYDLKAAATLLDRRCKYGVCHSFEFCYLFLTTRIEELV